MYFLVRPLVFFNILRFGIHCPAPHDLKQPSRDPYRQHFLKNRPIYVEKIAFRASKPEISSFLNILRFGIHCPAPPDLTQPSHDPDRQRFWKNRLIYVEKIAFLASKPEISSFLNIFRFGIHCPAPPDLTQPSHYPYRQCFLKKRPIYVEKITFQASNIEIPSFFNILSFGIHCPAPCDLTQPSHDPDNQRFLKNRLRWCMFAHVGACLRLSAHVSRPS